MKKSKLIAIILCLVMLLPMAVACGNNATPSPAPPSQSGTSSAPPASSPSQGATSSAPPAQLPQESIKPPVDPEAVPHRDTLNMAVDSDAGTLNPGYMTAQGLYIAMECVYEALWDFSERDGLIPILMESYEVVAPDHWIVKLRQGVTFSNGNKFTADDVLFSLAYWKTVGANAVRAQSLDAERTAKIDDYTVDLYTQAPFYLMHETGASMFTIFDEESFDEASIASQPIGTGPYVMTEYLTNSHLFLETREDYWGEKPAIKNLNFRVMAESGQIVNALSTNTVDIGRVALSDYAHVNTFPGFNMNARDTGGGVQVLFGAGHKGWFSYLGKDPEKVREARYAVIHAIDPQVILDVCYEGHGREMRCYSPDFCLDFEPAFNDLHPTYSIGYDVELARQYAQSSGLAGQTITLMTNGLPTMRTLAEIVQNMLAAIDVTVVINNTDPGTYQTARYDAEAEFDIACTEGIAPNWRVADGLVNSVRYSAAQSVPGAFPNNEYYLQVAPKTITTPDPAERRELLLETLGMFVENAVAYSFCIFQTAYAISSDIDMGTVTFNLSSGTLRIKALDWAG